MTCIVGIVASNGVVLASDSLGSGGGRKQEYATAKLITLEAAEQVTDLEYKKIQIGLGYTSSFRMGDILKHLFTPPLVKKDVDIENYMVSEFVPAIISCFDDHHYTMTEKGKKEGGNFLVAIKGRLFEVQEDFSVLETTMGFAAIGSGEAVAVGALYALGIEYDGDTTTSALVDKAGIAIQAASEFVTTVGGEIFILEISNE